MSSTVATSTRYTVVDITSMFVVIMYFIACVFCDKAVAYKHDYTIKTDLGLRDRGAR